MALHCGRRGNVCDPRWILGKIALYVGDTLGESTNSRRVKEEGQTVGSEEAEQWAKEWGPMVEHSPNMYEVPGSIPSGPSKKTEKQNNNKN